MSTIAPPNPTKTPSGPNDTRNEHVLGTAGSWVGANPAPAEPVRVSEVPHDEISPSEDQHRSRLASALDAKTSLLPKSPLITFLRWWLPAIACLIGIAIAVIDNFDGMSPDAMAGFLGAGLSIWLMNFLWRLGVSGDEERQEEEEARAFMDLHGHWPDEPGPDR